MFGGGDSKTDRQNNKMIKVQEDNFKQVHREIQGVGIFFIFIMIFFSIFSSKLDQHKQPCYSQSQHNFTAATTWTASYAGDYPLIL